jgi:hypothetical protein
MKDIFCAFILAGCLLTSCVDNYDAPCRDQVIAKAYTFSDVQTALMPYSANDTLVYAAGANDTLYFRTVSYLDSASVYPYDGPNNPECPNDFESHRIVRYVLQDSLSGYQLSYKALEQTGACAFTAGAETLEIPITAIGVEDSTFLDSVSLGSNTYYHLNRFTNNTGVVFYIHPTLGILQLKKDQKNYALQRFNSILWK